MASSSSTAQNPRHLLNHLYGGPTSAPPPTPSTQPSLSSSTSDAAADTLSRLLHRLPPSLSLPTRLSPRAPAKSSPHLPTLSLSSTSFPSSGVDSNLFELGYFQLTHHSITPKLAESAESESLSLFDLPLDEKLSSFPTDWPLGFNNDDDDDDDNDGDDHQTGSFFLDGQCSATNTAELSLTSLRELTRELEKLGLEVVEKLASAVGFENPFREGGVVGSNKQSSLMWVTSSDGDKARRVYPYVVGLQYQIRPRKWDLVSDSGSVSVEPQVGSVLVTLGDIAQVWSNGKLKKVRGRPAPAFGDIKSNISMTMLLTLPLESTVSPLLLVPNYTGEKEANNQQKDKDNQTINPNTNSNDGNDVDNEDQRIFNSFSFEDYAWRVYHERLLFKDPLDRYRVIH
ncbi:hypothetical protein SOVF_085060 [Spinacia oleracea]|nr:hypothetical protein SOVF_085060 [Spinacia oleracea]